MTPEEKREMARDAQLCDALGIPYRTVYIVTNNGGKSAYYHSDYQYECVAYLEDIRKRFPSSWQAKGEVSEWRHYPLISTDWSAMKLVIDAMKARGYEQVTFEDFAPPNWQPYCRADFYINHRCEPTGAEAPTIPLAVREAACLALGLPPIPIPSATSEAPKEVPHD